MCAIGLLTKDDWLVVGWVLAVKFLLFVFGAKSYQILEDKSLQGARAWFEIWNRWDSLHFQRLAHFGYSGTDTLKAWFYPLFPWSVRLFGHLTGDYLVGAFIVSAIASIVAAVLLRRLVNLDYPAGVAQRATWFFLIFPTAYFLHIGYTESLFLALGLGSLMAARTERWWLAGVLGGLAWMTRAPGAILFPTLAVEAMHQYWIARRWKWQWLWIALVPIGFGVYLMVNWQVTGDPFAFLRMRQKLFAMSTSWPWVGIRETIRDFDRTANEAEMVGAKTRAVLRDTEFDLHDRELDQIAAALRDVDDRELVAFYERDLYREHAALHIDAIPNFHPVRFGGEEPILECGYHCLVAPLSCAFRQPFCAGLVGVLTELRGVRS